MDYEQKYKEALERAKHVHTTNVDENKKSTEYIFPELKESEDEKIRKWLINEIKIKHHNLDEENIEFVDKAIAWLEKQGHMLDPDKVIEWLKAKVYDDSTYGMAMIDKFKKDFGLWNDKMN